MDQSILSSTPMSDFGPPMKRGRMTPPTTERVMLYVRQENEEVYTPLHVVPPTTIGLLNAVSDKEQKENESKRRRKLFKKLKKNEERRRIRRRFECKSVPSMYPIQKTVISSNNSL